MVVEGAGQQLAKDGSEWFFTKGMRGEGAGKAPYNKLVEGSKSYSHGLTNNTF